MLTTLKFRIYPSKKQESRLLHYFEVGRRFYNHSLEQRIKYYKETGKSLSNYDQNNDLTVLRSVSKVLGDVPCQVGRDSLRRLDKAFKNFFRRIKENKDKPGFPRFKGSGRWNSFSLLISGGGKRIICGSRIKVTGVSGLIRSRNVRPYKGVIKEQKIVCNAGKWSCHFTIDDGLPIPPLVPVKSAVGIDLGLKSFAVLSTGEEIANPRFYRKKERKLKRIYRSISRKVKGSNNRRKNIKKLQCAYFNISNKRFNFTHHLSKRIVNEHQFIAVEKLTIPFMVRSRFAKSILDAAWWQFIWQVGYKAEKAGCQRVDVDPRYTSQDCSRCGERVQKDLSVRVHNCPKCGLQLDRDHNAALNVLQRAITAPGIGVSKAYGSATKPKRSRKS